MTTSASKPLPGSNGPSKLHPEGRFDSYRDSLDTGTPRSDTVKSHPESWTPASSRNSWRTGMNSKASDAARSASSAQEAKKKRFVCPHCMRTFARSGHLQRHERSHTNERPFHCPHCSSTFGRLDTLLRHERTLHGSSASSASNNPTHRLHPNHSGSKSGGNQVNSTASQAASHSIPPLDPQLTRSHELPTMTHTLNASPPTMPGLSTIHPNPQSPSLILNGAAYSLSSTLLPHTSPPMAVPPSIAQPTPHKPSFPPLAGTPALWDSFSNVETLQSSTPSASLGDIQSQFSRLLFNLLPTGSSVPPTPGPVAATPGPISSTPNLDSFIHSPSPMSFPLSQERGLVIPTHVAVMSSPASSSSSYPPGKTPVLRSLEDLDLGVLESYIAECDMDVSLRDFELPKKDALNRYLCAYFEGMHQHHPFIHIATFDSVNTKVPLFLSMCCIGALYCFERDTSQKLHIAARKLIYSHLENKSHDESRETWVLQTLLLTMIYAAYSGDPKIFERGLALQSVLGNLLRNQVEFVKIEEDNFKNKPMSWEQWIAIEGFKRTYYSVYCFFTQLCMTFDIPPGITNAEPRLSLPCSEAEWRATDPESWYVLHTSPNAPPTPAFNDALHDLFSPSDDSNTGIRYSHFGLFVMINAICSQLWCHLKLRVAEPEMMLALIELAIDQWQRAWGADPDCSMSPTSPHGPLSFNASALYRMANVRLFRDYSRVKASFRLLDAEKIVPVMVEEVSGVGWVRNQEMVRAVMPATLQLQIPIKMGIKLVARTAALVWSVEHVLCATESGLLLCDWLRSIENEPPGTVLNQEEQKVLNLVKELLTEADISVGDGERLSAATLNVWAGTFDDVWVWGLTPVLARALRRFAEEIQETRLPPRRSAMDPPPPVHV